MQSPFHVGPGCASPVASVKRSLRGLFSLFPSYYAQGDVPVLGRPLTNNLSMENISEDVLRL